MGRVKKEKECFFHLGGGSESIPSFFSFLKQDFKCLNGLIHLDFCF